MAEESSEMTLDVPANMRIWERVDKTDPREGKGTKKVKQGGRTITAICAQLQVKRATEMFGPLGIGWGLAESQYVEQTLPTGHIVATYTAELWIESKENTSPVSGCCELFIPAHEGYQGKQIGDKVDTDAYKKATTDALTKGLSRLGFNADIFLGLFEDNKYIQETSAEFAESDRADTPPPEPEDPGVAKRKEIIRGLLAKAKGAGLTAPELMNALVSRTGVNTPADLATADLDILEEIRDNATPWLDELVAAAAKADGQGEF